MNNIEEMMLYVLLKIVGMMLTSYAYVYDSLIESKKVKLGSMIANLLLTL